MNLCVCSYCGLHVEVRGHLVRVCSLLTACGAQGLNLDCQPWQQMPSPAGPYKYFGWSLQLLGFQYFNFQYMVWIHRCETDGYEEPTMLIIPWTQHGSAPTPHNSSVCLHTMSETFTSGLSGELKKMKFTLTTLRGVVWQVEKTHPKL